ncbi:MAG: hypothetical protein ACJA0Q_001315, partial [Saprospiraceae bacterium]
MGLRKENRKQLYGVYVVLFSRTEEERRTSE